MALLPPNRTLEFNIGSEHFKVIETTVHAHCHIIAIVSVTERWSWKTDIRKIETNIVQFYGDCVEDTRHQCDEWLNVIANVSLQEAIDSD